jgi:DNA-binding Lrp family transcriptional regulator
VCPLSEQEREVVRHLQSSLPVGADPFGDVARKLGCDPAALLDLLRRWKNVGVIRRIGLIVRHHRLGFSANSMCVWKVGPDRIEAAGRIAGQNPHVTHCYERPSSAAFPFNLYAMIHARTRAEAKQIFEQITADAALPPGRMMWSVREFKKSSPVFFCEPPAIAAKEGDA